MQTAKEILVPKTPDPVAQLTDRYRTRIDTLLQQALAGTNPMYGMLRYFMGYEEEDGSSRTVSTGKRIRPSLFLYAYDACGGKGDSGDLAVAIELFHNFTLIHDDIEDNDLLRRGRKTVWAVWGINHGINAGDFGGQLTTRHLLRAVQADPRHFGVAAITLQRHFEEVIEGQYLDFELASKKIADSQVTEALYLEMVRKKTSVLLGGALEAGGMAAGVTPEVSAILYRCGESLGVAYQIADDIASLWGKTEATGKQSFGDLYEKKKTLPILYAREHESARAVLDAFYERSERGEEAEVSRVFRVIHESGAFEKTKQKALWYKEESLKAVDQLPVSETHKMELKSVIETFVQFPAFHE